MKSFEHPFDRLEDRCTVVLDLIPNFDERAIRDQADWTTTLYPKLKGFLQTAATDNQHLRLILDAHVTLAFAAGSVLNIKSGRNIEIEQRTIHRNVWHSNDKPRDPSWPGWQFDVEPMIESNGDMAVAVCLTHDVVLAVKAHVAASLPQVGSLLIARPTCGAGAKSVICGQHAFDLAEALALQINQQRHTSRPPLHLFIAAPNAFTFFLGQRQPGLGKATLYEYDFEGRSIRVPDGPGAFGSLRSMKYSTCKDIDSLVRSLLRTGWRFHRQGRKHGRLTPPSGCLFVTVSCTPSDRRTFLNLRSQVRHVMAELQQ